AGLVAERHVLYEWKLIAADQVGPLVTVHADAVAKAVREVFVIRSVTCVGDDLARGVVDTATRLPGSRRFVGSFLRTMNDVEDLLLLVGGLAHNEGATDVRAVAFDLAAAIDKDDVVFLDRLRINGAVWECGVLADEDERTSRETELVVGGFDEGAELVVGHARL